MLESFHATQQLLKQENLSNFGVTIFLKKYIRLIHSQTDM